MRREKNKWRRRMGGGVIGVISVEVESYPIIALLFLLLYRTQGLHFDCSRQRMKMMAIIINKKNEVSLFAGGEWATREGCKSTVG